MRQVRAASLTGYIAVARSLGLDPFAQLRRAKIGPLLLDDLEHRLPAAPVVELLEQSATLSGCESFAIRMAEARSVAHVGPLSLLLQHLDTIDEVVKALIQYRRLINDIVTLECEHGKDVTLLKWVVAPGHGGSQITDLVVALGYQLLTAVSGRRWEPEIVHFTHRCPLDARPFRRFFSARLEFGSTFSGYSCATASLQAPTVAAEGVMARNARYLLALVPLPPEQAPVSGDVERAVALLLPVGKATLDRVAASLDMNPRTLQRSLALESTSFNEILNDIRRDLARHYLANSPHSIATISDLTGYASPTSFSRWFVAEFGATPLAWRRAALRPGRRSAFSWGKTHVEERFVESFRQSPAYF